MDDMERAQRRILIDGALMFAPEPREARWMALLSAMMAFLATLEPWRVKEARWN